MKREHKSLSKGVLGKTQLWYKLFKLFSDENYHTHEPDLAERNSHPTCWSIRLARHSLDIHLWLHLRAIWSSVSLACLPYWDEVNCTKTRKERWGKVTSIHLPQEKKIIKLIFASINRKDESTLLKCSGYRSVPPCISNGGHRYVTGTTLSKFSSMQWLSCRALSPQVSSLIQHLENTPSAISNCKASAWDH